jgi:single-strand DNA-binding protein
MFVRKRVKCESKLAAPSRNQIVRHKHEARPQSPLLFRCDLVYSALHNRCLIAFFFSVFSFTNNFFYHLKLKQMNIIGRITAEAKVKTLKDERQLVEFTVAVNHYYKPKGKEQGINTATFWNCSFWQGTRIAERLKKGSLVEVTGGLTVNPYNDMNGNAKASLNFHVDSITIHHTIKTEVAGPAVADITEPMEDLPF